MQWDVPAGITTYAGFVSAGGTASDNCTGAIAISFSDATTPGTCANKFTVTRTYTATDVCGNTATSNQTITVNDNVAPTITAPSGTTVTCSGDVPAGITTYSGFVSAGGTASDNCTGAIAISFSDATTPGTCANKFTVTRTYTATDVCGNTATSNQTITVNDNVAPTITAPSGTTVTCSGDVPAGITTYAGFVSAGGTASDNCTGAIAISFSDATTPGTCANKFTVTRTYTATDVCGNTATSNQTITVNDNVAPTITAPSGTTVTCSGMYRQVSQPIQVLYQQEEQQVIIVQEQLRSASVMQPHREHVPISLQ
jgi:ribosomal protein S26